MRHLTETGYYAGHTWCGAHQNEHDTYAHYGSWVHNPALREEMCPGCRAILEEMEEEDALNGY